MKKINWRRFWKIFALALFAYIVFMVLVFTLHMAIGVFGDFLVFITSWFEPILFWYSHLLESVTYSSFTSGLGNFFFLGFVSMVITAVINCLIIALIIEFVVGRKEK